jgi:hypothetical protein
MRKKPKQAKQVVKPEATVFVACDEVSQDPNTGKHSLHGIFDDLSSETFPFTQESFSLFAKLVGGKGKQVVSLELTPPGGKSQKLLKDEVDFGYGETVCAHFDMSKTVYPKPGKYKLRLLFGRSRIGPTVELSVSRRKKKQ